MTPMYIQFSNITKQFDGTKALNDIFFEIWKREVHFLCDENGSKNFTLIKLCADIIQLTKGEILINKMPVNS